ncbi:MULTISPECIES: signal peptidase I [Cohnella]|jgi:signal peptidase I|uniref:signal peptidase I n=1 Tax=Cohnella TaxID=329857 RepID=UPI000379E5C5|nr:MULTISPECIES: signal peptidase I [Cohnella]REK60603.1 MAG: signal peptidase I [Cohnella sp.]
MNEHRSALDSVPPGKARASRPARPAWVKEALDWAKALAIALIIVFLLRAFVFQLSTVKSISMQPTLYEKEWLFINKISYEFGHPERGDVVILRDPSEGPDRKPLLVKRIIGMPGDTLEIRGGQLYINGELKVEPYTDSAIEDGDFGPVTVSEGHYFVMGDNRRFGASKDSRTFKEVPESLIIGKAEAILWPITRWARL